MTPPRTTRAATISAQVGLSLIFAAAMVACGGGGGGGLDPQSVAIGKGASGATGQSVEEDKGAAIPAEGERAPIQAAGSTAPAAGPLGKVAGRVDALAARSARARIQSATPLSAAPLGQLTPQVPGALNITSIEVGQTHMLPNGIKHFPADLSPKGREETLRLKPFQTALAVVDLSAKDAINPVIEAWWGDERVGAVPLSPPSEFPKTESDGPKYRTHSYSAVLPAAFIDRNIQLKVSASNYAAGNSLPLDVTGDIAAEVRILPFFFFGATEENSGRPIATHGHVPALAQKELQARMPFWITTEPNPAGKVVMETVSVGPNGTEPARLVRGADDPRANELGEAIGWGVKIIMASGEIDMPVLSYSPLAYRYSDGRVRSSNTGGLGYSGEKWWSSAGDWDYAGVFIHEMGHNFGLPHVGDAYKAGTYPYENGSLKGSVWGWDSYHSLLLPPFVPTSSSNHASCATSTTVARDEQGRCVKQDMMQGGSGWQASGQRFGPISDFSAARMQRSVNTKTIWPLGEDDKGNATFQKLNPSTNEFEAFTPATASYGAYGIAGGLPQKMNVEVYTLLISASMTTPEASQIHAPLHYNGNLLYTIDPTNAADLAAIAPGKGQYRQYCHQYGCDFTLHVTYADGSQQYQLLQAGVRPWWSPNSDMVAGTMDPLKSASFKEFAVNVPGNKRLTRAELLYTPKGWEGIGANPRVLVSRNF